MDSLKENSKKPRNPRENASTLSALTFLWTLKIFWKGFWQELLENDLYEPLEEHTSEKLGNMLEKNWREEEEKAKVRKRKPRLLRAIIKTFGFKFLLYGINVAIVELVLRVSQPLLLGGLIRYFSLGSTVTKQEAYFFATGVIIFSALTVLALHPYMMGIMHTGMKIRISCCSLIYRKALRLSKTALGCTTAGQVVNLLSNDVNRFDQSVIFLHTLWIAPIQTFIVMYFLWDQIGFASVIGVITILIFIPFQGWLGQKASHLRMRTALRTDERVRLMNEIITGIQVIKMYTWEIPFSKIVSDIRKKEIKEIRNSSYIRGVLLSFLIFHARLAIFTSIFAYVLLGNNINAEKVFVVISFYNVIRQSMTVFFPQGIGQAAEVLVSVKRLETFLMYDEIGLIKHNKDPENNNMKGKVVVVDEGTPLLSNGKPTPLQKTTAIALHKGIEVRKASAKWFEDAAENTLSNINLRIEPGKLTAIIGTVGAGKTSLLHAILKELPLTEGSISVDGTISYASQEPWLFASSVRQNILFGSEYNKQRYHQVVKVCALKTDFDQFPYGDKTIVGERGVALSGGQRARINLARAVYKTADIYLLDDPLSAVDTHVGKHIFEKCITGYLENKTCILITHQLQYLAYVKHIVFMENGKIKAEGNYKQLQQEAEEFTKLISSEQDEKPKASTVDSNSSLKRSRLASFQSIGSLDCEDINTDDPTEIEEMRSHGSVDSGVYKSYFTSGGSCSTLLLMVFLLVFTQLLASGGDYWITFWVNVEEFSQNYADKSNTTVAIDLPFTVTRNTCLYVFTVLTIGTVVVTFLRSFLFFYMCTQASMKLHNSMFNSITRATMRFFNTNSSGQILNRFSKDIGAIDELLPQSFIDCLQIGMSLIGIIAVITFINYMMIIPTVIIAIVFYYIRIFYLSTSRSIKRLEGVTRSPVFAHLNASIQGLTTIRAFQAQSALEMEFDHHQDLHSSAYFIFLAASRAFGYWLDLVCIIYIAIVTYSFLTVEIGDTFGGSVGLAITQSIGLTGMLQWGMRQSAELENQMTSVERVYEYTTVESEPALESTDDKKPPSTWPEKGKIIFSNVFMTYAPGDPPVLKNLCFVVKPKEKIGIVGRTGAGKSSLITALFHLTEIEGDIIIDNININAIGLHDLRSKISIIPQEPVLFSGTIRKNLDPFDEYSDYVLWNALEEVELKEVINDLPGGLNGKMSEGGSNFSVGQRQLVCLARAIVRNNRILVMDEATANVDPQTDALIQSAIRQKFAQCTVLTIAHRLHTVMDSDKILVMGNGSVVEYNHPHILLQDSNSTLSSMVGQMGSLTAERLRQTAADNYKRRTI